MEAPNSVASLEVIGPVDDLLSEILTPAALVFLNALFETFEHRRTVILSHRLQVQTEIDSGFLPDFPSETHYFRESDWQIGSVPGALKDRRVEIVGPVTREAACSALNSGASGYIADFEDAHSPTWKGTLHGQLNLRDAVSGMLFPTGTNGGEPPRQSKIPSIHVRPRGWHLVERHVLFRGRPVSATLFDFGLYLFHNVDALLSKGTGPYFYLPKLEHYLEARLWNDIFVMAQKLLNIPVGTIKATVLIETLPAALQANEIIWELKEHIVGLSCSFRGYVFSFIKRFHNIPGYIFPDRFDITTDAHCIRACSRLLVKTCHRRGLLAIGEMETQAPITQSSAENAAVLQTIRANKIREAHDGFDGTRVSYPATVAIAREAFDKVFTSTNQLHVKGASDRIWSADLLELPTGRISEKALRANINASVRYMAHWLSGNGWVPLDRLMGDAMTLEISRIQVWQWLHHLEGVLDDGRKINMSIFRRAMAEEIEKLQADIGSDEFKRMPFALAAELLFESVNRPVLEEFLTLSAYEYLD